MHQWPSGSSWLYNNSDALTAVQDIYLEFKRKWKDWVVSLRKSPLRDCKMWDYNGIWKKDFPEISQSPLNTEVFRSGVEFTTWRSGFEHKDAAVSVCRRGRTLLQRDTCWEAWLSRGEAVKWTVWQDWQGHDRCSPPQPPASNVTTKAGKGTWQVEGAEVMASGQRRGELLKKRTVSQRGLRESLQSCTRTVGSLCVCIHVSVYVGSVHMQVIVRLWNGNSWCIQTLFLTLQSSSSFFFVQLVRKVHTFSQLSQI